MLLSKSSVVTENIAVIRGNVAYSTKEIYQSYLCGSRPTCRAPIKIMAFPFPGWRMILPFVFRQRIRGLSIGKALAEYKSGCYNNANR